MILDLEPLASSPGTLDVYWRRVTSRVAERDGPCRRLVRRVEEGLARRRRSAAGAVRFEAESTEREAVEEDGEEGADLADPGPLAARAAGLDRVRVQVARVEESLLTAAGFRGEHRRLVAVAHLEARGRRGLLARTRLARCLTPEEVAGDAAALRQARRLSYRARSLASAPERVLLEAAVAARMLSALATPSAAGLAAPGPDSPPAAVQLVDDPTPGGGPFGCPFDGDGRPTRRRVLHGRGALAPGALGTLRRSFAEPPLAAPANLRLEPPEGTPEPEAGSAFRAVELEEVEVEAKGLARFGLLGHDPQGGAFRLDLALDLAGLLDAVAAAGRDLWWAPGAGAVGSPTLVLRLGRS